MKISALDVVGITAGICSAALLMILLHNITLSIVIISISIGMSLIVFILAKFSKPRLNLKEHVAKIRQLESVCSIKGTKENLVETLLKEIENNNYF